MKKISLLTITCILMQSCNSQQKDLAQITFTEKYNNFFGDIPNKFDDLTLDTHLYNSYESESEKILYFNGVDLSGYRDEKGKFDTNNAQFAFSKNDNTLSYYSIMLFTNKKVNKLIEVINSKIGKPSYISMLDKKDTLPDGLLWEDATRFYILTGATQSTPFFIVFNKKISTLREQFISGAFLYYQNYLKKLEQKRLTKETYSYKDFVDEMSKEGRKLYLENYRKP